MGRISRNLVFILIVLGIAVRIRQYAACPSYWYDESYLLLNVFNKSFVELLGPLRDNQAAPPLFLWLLRGLYHLGGGSEWSMRLPALAASLAGLFVMVPLARRISGPHGRLWAIAFCAFGHHATLHANEVKPYALDFLMTGLIVFAALRCRSAGGSWRPHAALCLLGVLSPWVSYPSVFVLGSTYLALLIHGFRHPHAPYGGTLIKVVCAAGGLSVLSSFMLWRLAVCQQATPNLNEFWDSSFVDLSSPGATLVWMGRCLNEIGNYGTREMGLPMILLALVGAASLRRRPARLVLLIGPLAIVLAVSALRLYPLGGRLVFFLVPCLWLLAARGIDVLTVRLSVRLAWLGWTLPALLLVPTLLWAGQRFIAVVPRCQFREAFAYVEAHRKQGDFLWVSHPQVYEVYQGYTPHLSAYSSPEVVEQAVRASRLWMICAVAGSRERYTAPDTVARVRATSCVVLDRRRFRGLEVVLYGPQPSLTRPGSATE